MKIDLVAIPSKGIDIDEVLTFEEEISKQREIQRLIDTRVLGRVYYNAAEEVILDVKIKGRMVLLDAKDLSEIEYPFEVDINEKLTDNDEYNLEKEQNVLDIMSILWQNIVLEVPMRVVKEENESVTLQGEGWELVSEEEESRHMPLMDLLKERKE